MFIFYSKWTKIQECEDIIEEEWNKPVNGSRMFRVQQKLKWCKLRFIKWSKERRENARKELGMIHKEMEAMQKMEGIRDSKKWKLLKTTLNEAYKSEEKFWAKKTRVNLLKEGNKNTKKTSMQ